MASAAHPIAATAPAAQPPLPDELLEYIFLRLDNAEDLARAAASFRRIVSARGFLRRFRSLHPPPVLGFIDSSHGAKEFHQAQPPRKTAPAARAFAHAADFTFSFLADPSRWRVRDARDGRVLLARIAKATPWLLFDEFVVYDPLHHRHVQIPPIPGDLTAFTATAGSRSYDSYFEPFLAPAVLEEEESSLRVFCSVMCEAKVVTLCFSSVTGMWQTVASCNIGSYEWMRCPALMKRHCVHGCFYWTDYDQKVTLVLDTLEMKFSVVDLPPESFGKEKSIVEMAEGRLGLLILGCFEFNLYSKTRRSNGAGAEAWRHDNVIPLPDRYWSISNESAAEGYVLIRGIPQDQYNSWKYTEKKPEAQYFTLELKTLLFERLCGLKFETSPGYLYASFPPPLSPPSI